MVNGASSQEDESAYRGLPFARLGTFGVTVPRISLGCWNNFGADADDELCRQLVFTAFDRGYDYGKEVLETAGGAAPKSGGGRGKKKVPSTRLQLGLKKVCTIVVRARPSSMWMSSS